MAASSEPVEAEVEDTHVCVCVCVCACAREPEAEAQDWPFSDMQGSIISSEPFIIHSYM